ncbi:MAG: peptide deformylase [Dehalococcoidia bacterium]|nr:peptide deformylase [Dehalococcoidia bacterium]|tara:strand:+ start:1862 stop:2431 length:570 start_codon:yes stop_codon:yes gene_type:complete
MAILPIITFPDKILRKKARKIKTIDKSIKSLSYDMLDTMNDAGGIGLAANQVGVLKRLIVVQIPEEEEPRIYINPEIIYREGSRMVEEGCLSVPGFIGTVERSIWVKFRALNLESKTVRIKADSLLAQVLEHEVDHLNGILYMDHLSEHEKLRSISEEEYSSTLRPVQKLNQAEDLTVFHPHSESEINP